MHTATMREAFKAKGVRPGQFQAPKQERPAAPAPAKKVANETIEIRNGVEFVLIFSCSRAFLPDGIQVIPMGGSNSGGAASKEPEKDVRFSNMRVDLDSLISRCSVDSFNVLGRGNYRRVYVHCTMSADGDGFKFWHGPYEDLVRKAMRGVWKRAILKDHPDDHTSLEMRDVGGDAEVRMRFGIKN